MIGSCLVAFLLCAISTQALPTSNSSQPTYWKPAQGITFDCELENPPSTTKPTAAAMGIDLFDNVKTTITGLKANGAHVICYFSAGTYENWRPDWKATSNQIGKALPDWPGEWWADIRLQSVRNVMAGRIALAASKGCDAVDPDNMDGYDNDNGLGLTAADSVNYMTFLASTAHNYGLSISLKNALDILNQVTTTVDFAVNEQCHEYDECSTYANFVKAGKNVFHVEYPKGESVSNNKPANARVKNAICQDPSVQVGFSTVLKNIDLDSWLEFC